MASNNASVGATTSSELSEGKCFESAAEGAVGRQGSAERGRRAGVRARGLRRLGLGLAGGVLAVSGVLALAADGDAPATRPSAATVLEAGDTTDAPAATTRRSAGRLPERATLSDAEYEKIAADLRKVYSLPPSQWPKPTLDAGVEHRELGPVPAAVHPANNPYSKAKAELGRTLFYDPRLSGSGQMSCVSCHDNDLGWADGRTVAFGHKVSPQKRNTPSILNSAFSPVLFWDGRASSLEEQALGPIGNPGEMHSTPDEAAERIAAVPEYRAMFKEAFGSDEISAERLAMAIACFERTIVSGSSKFDYFLNGRTNALSDAAVRGLHLYRTDARCLNCHNGPEMSDHKFHNLGISHYGKALQDLGRYVVTKDPKDVGAFKTPGLRNVTRTFPYMHHGLFDLDEAVVMYNAGGFTMRRPAALKDDPLFPEKSPLLKPLGLNRRDLDDIKAFLASLEEPRIKFRAPKIPE